MQRYYYVLTYERFKGIIYPDENIRHWRLSLFFTFPVRGMKDETFYLNIANDSWGLQTTSGNLVLVYNSAYTQTQTIYHVTTVHHTVHCTRLYYVCRYFFLNLLLLKSCRVTIFKKWKCNRNEKENIGNIAINNVTSFDRYNITVVL